MAKFRTKSVVIDAVQWDGNLKDIAALGGAREYGQEFMSDDLVIHTLGGNMMTASKGDWIIRGVNGEIRPCEDEIFRMTYDEVEMCNAARDMLVALKAARGVIDRHKAPLTFDRINDAIAKAEGRQSHTETAAKRSERKETETMNYNEDAPALEAEIAKLRAAIRNMLDALDCNDESAAYAYAKTALGNEQITRSDS